MKIMKDNDEKIKINSALRHLNFLKYKPLVVFKVINGFLRKIILRQDILRTVDLAITGECHYRCVFCSAYRLYNKGGPFLTVEQIRDIWKQCIKLGVMHVNLTGGEPLLRNFGELIQIVKNFRSRYFLISLVSNGLNVTKDKLMKLKEAGLDTLQLSIESTDSNKHDEMTGIEGSFAKVIDAINYAKESRLNVCLNVVFYNGNADEVRKLIDFSKKNRIFLVLNTVSLEGRWRDSSANRLQQEDAAIFNEFLRFAHVRHDSSFNFSGRRECPAGKERIHITAYGDVLTCPLVQVSYGNVLKEPLKDIYKRMCSMGHIRRYSRMCKHAFDQSYYQEILLPLEKREIRPALIFDHPLYRRLKYGLQDQRNNTNI